MYSVNQINDNKADIRIVKGDTFRKDIMIINDDKLKYIPGVGDKIVFCVFNRYTDSTPIFEKEIRYDELILELKASETAKMKYGNYVYVIRLKRHNGDVDTFIHGSLTVEGVID